MHLLQRERWHEKNDKPLSGLPKTKERAVTILEGTLAEWRGNRCHVGGGNRAQYYVGGEAEKVK